MRFTERARNVEASESAVAGRIEGKRLAYLREDCLREALKYATSSVKKLKRVRRSQTDSQEADGTVVRGLLVERTNLKSSRFGLGSQLSNAMKRWGIEEDRALK